MSVNEPYVKLAGSAMPLPHKDQTADFALQNLAIDLIVIARGDPFMLAHARMVERLRAIPSTQHITDELYNRFLYRIIRNRQTGGWPPRDVGRVSGWIVVRLLAEVFGKSTREVAKDLIERYQHYEER
jgi:hypothetical protein